MKVFVLSIGLECLSMRIIKISCNPLTKANPLANTIGVKRITYSSTSTIEHYYQNVCRQLTQITLF